MSENVAQTPKGVSAAPEPKKTNWLLIGGIAVGVILLCVCAVCIGSGTFLTMAGPEVAGQFLGILCGLQYSNLTSDECNAWGTDIMLNHPDAYTECAAASRDSSGNTDMNQLFACFEDKGLGPND